MSVSAPDSRRIFRIVPGTPDGPLVVDVSRSGTRYPPEFQPTAKFTAVHRKVSPSVEELVLPSVAEGATVLLAEFPPTVVDPNRPVDDIDPDLLAGEWATRLNPLPGSLKSGSGLIHSLDADYQALYEGKLPVGDVERRISDFYVPYHDALAALLSERRHRFGTAFQLSCHSMSSVGPQDGKQRPEICLGDLDGATAGPDYVDAVSAVFRDRGFEVARNQPFRGNELLRRHAAPDSGCLSLQVEVRRDLYLDEETRALHDGVTLLQECFSQVAVSVRMLGAAA